MRLFLLALPCVIALATPLYNRVDPLLFGMPFFYWFQLLLVPLSALAIYLADRMRRS